MSRKGSIPRRRQNLLATDPHCHYCGREVREYDRHFAKGEPLPEDMATVDHVNQKDGKGPRPGKGSTVLACFPCNNKRGKAGQPEKERLPCVECGQLAHGGFCSAGCFTVNRDRLRLHQRPWEEHRRELQVARKKAKNRRRMLRRRKLRRQNQARTMPIDVFFADKTELGWRVAMSLFTENRRDGRSPSGPAAAVRYMEADRAVQLVYWCRDEPCGECADLAGRHPGRVVVCDRR